MSPTNFSFLSDFPPESVHPIIIASSQQPLLSSRRLTPLPIPRILHPLRSLLDAALEPGADARDAVADGLGGAARGAVDGVA